MKKNIALFFLLVTAVCGSAQDFVAPESRNKEIQLFVNFYANRRKNLTNQMLQRSYLYFPLIEKTLQQYQMPEELKYLAMVESTLNPTAKSRNGRLGLWQLTPGVAEQYGLHITNEVNDCFDPKKATEAACLYLLYLHEHFDNWLLAIAAYNSSVAIVKQAIEQAGNPSDYWVVHDYLPLETRGYVPALLALNTIMKAPEKLNH